MSSPRVVIVTGGADGFGAAIVSRFSKEGCKVIFLDINREKGEARAAADKNLHYMFGDVTLRETWESPLELALGLYGRVDVVVNNAGITYEPSPVHTLKIDLYERVLNLNVKPIFISAQVICPAMIRQGSGIFINITSTGCTRPRAGFAFYNASKAAVNMASKTMALEYAPTIRFNCIAPPLATPPCSKNPSATMRNPKLAWRS